MSRLATLSSKVEHYSAAIRGLVTLYIHRGYPTDEVHKWLYSNITKRWNDRLTDKPVTESTDVLVLKTQYNLAWDYFNAHQLGDVIFGYWREWLERADAGNFNLTFPPPDPEDWRAPRTRGDGAVDTWDMRKTSLFNSRIILSRKRTRNFMDLSNLWKKTVLENLEEQALDIYLDNAARFTANTVQRPDFPDVNAQVVGPRRHTQVGQSDEDNYVQRPHARGSSPDLAGSSWSSAPMGQWGRGSRR